MYRAIKPKPLGLSFLPNVSFAIYPSSTSSASDLQHQGLNQKKSQTKWRFKWPLDRLVRRYPTMTLKVNFFLLQVLHSLCNCRNLLWLNQSVGGQVWSPWWTYPHCVGLGVPLNTWILKGHHTQVFNLVSHINELPDSCFPETEAEVPAHCTGTRLLASVMQNASWSPVTPGEGARWRPEGWNACWSPHFVNSRISIPHTACLSLMWQ